MEFKSQFMHDLSIQGEKILGGLLRHIYFLNLVGLVNDDTFLLNILIHYYIK